MESVSFQIPAGYEVLRIAEKALRNLLILHKVEARIIDNCVIALQELLVNIVEHSYNENDGKMIEVRLQMDRKRFFIETRDTGAPENVTLEAISTSDPDEIQVRANSMTTTKALMDEVQYQYKDGKNIWTLIKKI